MSSSPVPAGQQQPEATGDRSPAEREPRETPRADRLWSWIGWIVAIAGTVWWARNALVDSSMRFEDGTVLFQRHYQEVSVAAVFGMWSGYASVLPNLIACLECRLPALYVPQAFAITEVVFLALAVTRFLERRFESVAPVATRVAVVAALAWMPIGDRAISGFLMYCQVPVLLWLALILLRPAGGGRPILDGVLIALFTWTHPMSVALAPVSVWRLREPAMRPVAITHLVASATYYLFGRQGGEHPDFAQFANVPAWIAVRVPFETVFGTRTQVLLHEAGLGWFAVAVGTCILGVLAIGVRCAWPRWSSATRLFVLGLVWMAVASAIGAVVLRPHMASMDYATRYPWPGRVAFLAIVVLVLATFVRVWWVLALLAAWVPWLAQFDSRYLTRSRSPEFEAFLQQVTEQEQRLGNRRALDIRFERPEQGPAWAIVLKPL